MISLWNIDMKSRITYMHYNIKFNCKWSFRLHILPKQFECVVKVIWCNFAWEREIQLTFPLSQVWEMMCLAGDWQRARSGFTIFGECNFHRLDHGRVMVYTKLQTLLAYCWVMCVSGVITFRLLGANRQLRNEWRTYNGGKTQRKCHSNQYHGKFWSSHFEAIILHIIDCAYKWISIEANLGRAHGIKTNWTFRMPS